MAKSTFITASGIVRPTGGGYIHSVNICKAGSADAVVTVYDNNTASGTKLIEISGAVTGTFILSPNNEFVTYANGLYVAISGTTAPTVQVSST